MENNNLAKTRVTVYQSFWLTFTTSLPKGLYIPPSPSSYSWMHLSRGPDEHGALCNPNDGVAASRTQRCLLPACDSMTLSEHASAVMSGNWLALVLAADELVGEWEAERWMRGCELEWVSYNGKKKEFRVCANAWITKASIRNYKKSRLSCLSWMATCV